MCRIVGFESNSTQHTPASKDDDLLPLEIIRLANPLIQIEGCKISHNYAERLDGTLSREVLKGSIHVDRARASRLVEVERDEASIPADGAWLVRYVGKAISGR